MRALTCAVFLVAGCAIDAPVDEGLFVEDGGAPFAVGQVGDSAPPSDPSEAGAAPMRACTNPELFSARVSPRLLKDCVRCHDGTKGKATQLFNLRELRSGGLQSACDESLAVSDLANFELSRLLTFVDPGNPSTQHDFKYATSAEFRAYRADVLAWLMAE